MVSFCRYVSTKSAKTVKLATKLLLSYRKGCVQDHITRSDTSRRSSFCAEGTRSVPLLLLPVAASNAAQAGAHDSKNSRKARRKSKPDVLDEGREETGWPGLFQTKGVNE